MLYLTKCSALRLGLLLTLLLLVQTSCTPKSTELTDANTISTETLAKTLADTSAAQTAANLQLFHVGFGALFASNHIPNSVYAGPTAEQRGIDKLMDATRALPKNANIVLYCGCCPWQNCPNVHPAFTALVKAGFTNVKVLKINDNLQTDWIDKGYPITR